MILNVNLTSILLRAVCSVALPIYLLTACGQRGPLYLPVKPAPATTQTQPATTPAIPPTSK